jgi:GATA-binding protein
MRQQTSSRVEQADEKVDQMNMDDFIVPTSVASPANISRSPSAEAAMNPATTVASAIPIKKQNELRGQSFPSSAPVPAPIQQRANAEFGYVQRFVRKTSIDERKVRTSKLGTAAHC